MRTMAYTSYFVVCALFMFSEAVHGIPAQATTSTQTQASPDYNTNVRTAFGNLQGGFQRLTNPMLNLGFSIIPNLVNKGLGTAQQAFGKIVGSKKDAVVKVAGGVGDVVGSGMVLGSAMAGGAMTVAGSGLGALNKGIKAGADAGLGIAGNLAEKAAQANEYGGEVASGALHRVANALQYSAGGANNVSDSMANMVDSLASYLSQSIHDSGNRVIRTMDAVSQRAANGTAQNVAVLRDALVNIMDFIAQTNQGLVKMMDNFSLSVASASANAANDVGVATGSETVAVETPADVVAVENAVST